MKISEGCDQKCSFCAIPLMRGKHISEPAEKLLNEARRLANSGTKELVLIAQDSTYYGKDQTGKQILAELLRQIAQIEPLEWVRLMYAYPRQFPFEILDVIAEEPKICKYVDIPLQHISDNVLKSMKRGIKAFKIKKLVNTIREKIPNVAIRSTFIVGYPNETEDDFRQLLDFIKEYELDRVGVFTYSHEEGTTAFPLGDPIPQKVKDERRGELMLLQQSISLRKNQAKIGRIFDVIIDGRENGYYIARSRHDAPEVDNFVFVESNQPHKSGDIINVTINKAEEYDLWATLTN